MLDHKDFKQGMFENVPAEEYHQRVLGVANKSGLDRVHQSPAHYFEWLNAPEEKETTALAFGKAFHCALLEPKVFASTYVVQPDFGDLRKPDNKAAKADWMGANGTKKFIDEEDAGRIQAMLRRIRDHRITSMMVRSGAPELTLRWIDKATGLPCKARADFYMKDIHTAVDFKTTDDASPAAFAKSIANYGYHRQEAFYRAGFDAVGQPIDHFVFVAIEKHAPYAMAIYEVNEEGVEAGRKTIADDLSTLASCVSTNVFPGYADTVQTLELPRWAIGWG